MPFFESLRYSIVFLLDIELNYSNSSDTTAQSNYAISVFYFLVRVLATC